MRTCFHWQFLPRLKGGGWWPWSRFVAVWAIVGLGYLPSRLSRYGIHPTMHQSAEPHQSRRRAASQRQLPPTPIDIPPTLDTQRLSEIIQDVSSTALLCCCAKSTHEISTFWIPIDSKKPETRNRHPQPNDQRANTRPSTTHCDTDESWSFWGYRIGGACCDVGLYLLGLSRNGFRTNGTFEILQQPAQTAQLQKSTIANLSQ